MNDTITIDTESLRQMLNYKRMLTGIENMNIHLCEALFDITKTGEEKSVAIAEEVLHRHGSYQKKENT